MPGAIRPRSCSPAAAAGLALISAQAPAKPSGPLASRMADCAIAG